MILFLCRLYCCGLHKCFPFKNNTVSVMEMLWLGVGLGIRGFRLGLGVMSVRCRVGAGLV